MRAAGFADSLGEDDGTEWKPVVMDGHTKQPSVPCGSVGFRWETAGNWNREQKNSAGVALDPMLSLLDGNDSEVAEVAFPRFGYHQHGYFTGAAVGRQSNLASKAKRKRGNTS